MDEKVENPYIIDCIGKDEDGFVLPGFVMTSEIAFCKKVVDLDYRIVVVLKGNSWNYRVGQFDSEEEADRFYNKVRAKMEVLTTPIAIPSLK